MNCTTTNPATAAGTFIILGKGLSTNTIYELIVMIATNKKIRFSVPVDFKKDQGIFVFTVPIDFKKKAHIQ
jgi:hypothetical protein